MIRRGWATEERIAQILAEQWQLPFRDAERVAVDPNALQRVPLAVARELRALPIGFENGGVVLAIADPNEDLFASVKSQVGEASYVVVARSVLDPLIESPSSGYSLEVGDDHGQGEASAAAGPGDAAAGLHSVGADTFREPFRFLALVEETSATGLEPRAGDPFTPIERASIAADFFEPAADAAPAEASREERPQGVAPADDDVTAQPAGVEAVIGSIDTATAELARARIEVEALGTSLSSAQTQLAGYEAALAAAAEARERDQATIRRLEAELAQRDDVFQALKGHVATLTRTLDSGEGDGHGSPPPAG